MLMIELLFGSMERGHQHHFLKFPQLSFLSIHPCNTREWTSSSASPGQESQSTALAHPSPFWIPPRHSQATSNPPCASARYHSLAAACKPALWSRRRRAPSSLSTRSADRCTVSPP